MNEIALNFLRRSLGQVRQECSRARAAVEAAKETLQEHESALSSIEEQREALEQALVEADYEYSAGAVIHMPMGRIYPAFS